MSTYYYSDGTISDRFELEKKLHREDGPALEAADGTRFWWVDDELHRLDGPAIESANGTKEWWLYGNRITEEEFNEITDPVQRKLIWGGK
jgi:hypothetical protein